MAKVEALVRDLESSVFQLKNEVTALEQFEQLFFKLFHYYLEELNKHLMPYGRFSVMNRLGTSMLDSKYHNSFLISFKPMKKQAKSSVGIDEDYNLIDKTSSARIVLVNLDKRTSEVYDVSNLPETVQTQVKHLECLLTALMLHDPPHLSSY